MPGYTLDQEDYRRRLARIEGQVRGLGRMIEDDAYCIDVLTQIASVTKALQGVALGLLDQHIAHCVVDAAARGEDEGAAKVTEAVRAVERLLRT
jgi:DNA-binding FrmR family transcriptional regulator